MMAKDAELDRVKAAQDLAFQRKQGAYEAAQRAWERRENAREALNRAHEAKQRAYDEQDHAWQRLQRIRDANGPRIDSLNSQQERAFQNMKAAFDNASSAHDRRDGAAARSYADEGHRYKAEAQGYVEQRRRLVEEIRSAKADHEAVRPAFMHAKDVFSEAKRVHEQAKAEHERAQAEFKRAKEAFDQASKAFRTRLEQVKQGNAKRNEDRKELARKAGVSWQYLDKVWVTTDADGTVNIYFGGFGEPNGPGHGHYVMDRNGVVSYRREPLDPHGAQNVVRDEALERRLSRIALDAFYRDQSSAGPRNDQYDDGIVTVKVKSGFNYRTNTIATDVIVIDRTHPDEHLHLVLSEHDGSVLFMEWRKNH